MNKYFQLKIEGQNDSTYKKLRELFGTGSYPYSVEQAGTIDRTLTGRLSKQIGPSWKRWYGLLKIHNSDGTGNGYATLADLELWTTSETLTNHKLVMRPYTWNGTTVTTTYNVAFVTKYDPQSQVPLADAIEGFSFLPFEIQERKE